MYVYIMSKMNNLGNSGPKVKFHGKIQGAGDLRLRLLCWFFIKSGVLANSDFPSPLSQVDERLPFSS